MVFEYGKRPTKKHKKMVDYITTIKLQVLGGTKANDVRLESVVDASKCLNNDVW